ncbi:hypothetical protein ACQJBY_031586 [Aegilops geniculata]
MAGKSHPNRTGGDPPSRGRDRGSLTPPPRFLSTGKSKHSECDDTAVVVSSRGGGRLASPPRFPGTGKGKHSVTERGETAGAAFSRGRGGPSPFPPFVDKGKKVASEQGIEGPTSSTGFVEDARRGFMADARRAVQTRTAPRPLPASSPAALANRSNRGDTRMNFTMKPLGSTIKKPFILDMEVYSKLLHHQKEGLEWLWRIHCCGKGGLLADDMGLGKTFQILAFIAGLIQSNLMKRVIIAVPTMVLDQWVTEMEEVGLKNYIYIFKDIKIRNMELMKVCQTGGILITTHTLATNNWSMLNISWDYLFIDEAHLTCKKSSLKAYRNLERLECRKRILITGTPAPNSLKEFRAILNFCCPGMFDRLNEFHDSYLVPLVEGNYKDSSLDQLNESSKASKKLQHLTRPCFLRRLKSVLSSVETPEKNRLTLPEKAEFVLWLKLTPYQEKLYRTFLCGDSIDKSNHGETIVASTLLHKICNHPKNLNNINEDGLDDKERAVLRRMVRKLRSSITTEEDDLSEDPASCKIDIILRLTERFKEEKHKVLVFSHTCEMLDTVEEALLKKGYSFDRIDGSLNQKVRAKRVQSFQKADGAPILLISSFCAGTGLDLPAASRAIIIEPFWNPRYSN